MDQIISSFELPCLLYDEQCPLCLRFKQSLERIPMSEEVHFYPIQDQRIYREFPYISAKQAKKEVHFIKKSQEVLTGAQVISYLVKLNPKVKQFSWLIESKMGEKALSIFYNTANKYRKSLRKCCHKCNH